MPGRIKSAIRDHIPPALGGKTREDPKNLQLIKAKLAKNSLTELRLVFEEVDFYSKRDVLSLITVIKEQFSNRLTVDKASPLKTIKIGWRLPNFAVGPVLQQVIPLLLQEPVRVTHIQLILNAWVPEDCLRRIVSWHTLESLDLRSVKVRRPKEAAVPPGKYNHNSVGFIDPFTIAMSSYGDESLGSSSSSYAPSSHPGSQSTTSNMWTEEFNICCMVPYMAGNIQTLKLVDCGINRGHIPELCKFLRRRRALENLSLRQNRSLDGGFDHLFQLPFVKVLDLSLCDLGAEDGYQIKHALATSNDVRAAGQHQHKQQQLRLQKLCLAGNYRLSEAVPELVKMSATRLQELDCSFCDVQGRQQEKVFHILANAPNCKLLSFHMQGTRINEVDGLVECVRCNTSLRRLVVNHPREPFPIQTSGMEKLSKALKWNYCIQNLKVDTLKRTPTSIKAEMDFWLNLNQCGRAALLRKIEKDGTCGKPWAVILAEAARKDDANLIYWLLKHGSATFHASQRPSTV